MKIGLISDIHGNLPALNAVLEAITQREVNSILNAGDSTGYGPFPDQVLEKLQNEHVLSIQGNYDGKVLKVGKKKPKWKQNKDPEKIFAFEWAYHQLSKKSRKYLKALPKEIRMKINAQEVLVTHGSPASESEHLLKTTPQERLSALAKIAKADIIICGHSHRAFLSEANGTTFINPGSVGRPDDGDPRAAYAILKISKSGITADFYRIDYNIKNVLNEIKKQNLPANFAKMFALGLNLDNVKAFNIEN